MAREGMKFTSFYAQTVCGPARAALMTGCYPMRTERVEHDNGLVPHPAMSLNEVTIPELLKPLGYKTAMMGKWDLAGRGTRGKANFRVKLNPSNQGFDYWFWTQTSGSKLDRSFFFYQHQSLRAVRCGDWKLHLAHTEIDRTKEGERLEPSSSFGNNSLQSPV